MTTTACDPLTTADALALLSAIDAGDDAALLPLADLLEEAGDPRAEGLRRACRAHLRTAEAVEADRTVGEVDRYRLADVIAGYADEETLYRDPPGRTPSLSRVRLALRPGAIVRVSRGDRFGRDATAYYAHPATRLSAALLALAGAFSAE